MTRRVLVIGHSPGLLDALARLGADAPQVYLLVEPSVLAAHPGEFDHPVVAQIRTARYVFSDEAVDAGVAWHAESGFDAVLPGKEHAVRAAAALADKLGLGNPGDKAVAACTDKLVFRDLVHRAAFPSPRYRAVESAGEVAEFFDAVDGRPIVLKPRCRNGSLGVRCIRRRDDIAAAWAQAVATDEGMHKPLDRPLEWTYLVEEFLPGREVSVEMLVQAGEIVFTNVTAKTVAKGPWFPEMSHRVPADVSRSLQTILPAVAGRLARAMQVRDGLLHSEWRITDKRAYPLECAARFAGDRIPWLIERAYGVNLADAWLRCLARTQPVIEATVRRHATIRFLRAAPGVVTAVHGLDDFRGRHHVLELSAPQPGDVLAQARDSHSRPGFAVFDAATAEELDAAIADFDALLRVETSKP